MNGMADLIESDFNRFFPNSKFGLARVAITCLYMPGVLCCVLMRFEQRIAATGRLRIAGILRSLNVTLTGADFYPGFSIGPGLLAHHPNGIVIGYGAVIGSNCTILHQVTLGESDVGPDGDHKYPKVGDGVTIGAGARLLGGITIGDGATIGAGSLVLSDVPANATAVGSPARVLGDG